MKFAQIVTHLDNSIWAIEPNKLRSIVAFLNVRLAGGKLPSEDIQEATKERRKPLRQVKGGVAVLPIFGTLIQRAGGFAEMSGAADPSVIGTQFDELIADDSVGAIVLHVDSPGGVVFGIKELTDKIYGARGQGKRVVAVADGYAASAAYNIASAAEEVIASPSSLLGSIGVYQMHIDVSKFEENEGIKTTLVSAGKYKVEGNPYEPLGDDARAAIQTEVDEFYSDFVASVARNRGVSVADVKGGYGEGRVLTAKRAVAEGLADRVGTLQSVLETLTGSRIKSSSSKSVRRRRMELAKKRS